MIESVAADDSRCATAARNARARVEAAWSPAIAYRCVHTYQRHHGDHTRTRTCTCTLPRATRSCLIRLFGDNPLSSFLARGASGFSARRRGTVCRSCRARGQVHTPSDVSRRWVRVWVFRTNVYPSDTKCLRDENWEFPRFLKQEAVSFFLQD